LPDAPASFVINLRDADIRALSEQVSEITGRTLILDPAVSGEVTVISAQPLDPAGVWDLFQSVLRVQGYAALRSGTIWRVIPQEGVREAGGELSETVDPGRLDVVTRLVKLRNFPVTTAVGALRPLVANFGYIEALPETNTLVITDNAENVERIEDIARTLDEGDGSQVSTIPIRNADAAEIAAALENVLGTEAGGLPPRVAIDSRANVLLVRGDPDMTATVRRLAAELDQPGRQVPSLVPVTRVYRLRFADAVTLAEVLRGVIGAQAGATSPVAQALVPPVPVQERGIAAQFGIPTEAADTIPAQTPLSFAPPPVASLASEDITIQPAPDINALVVRARMEVQADLGRLIEELDQRRPQVLIEAAIVEISGDISEQLGIQLGFGDAAPPGGFAATSFSPVGLQLDNILGLLGVPASAAIAPQGLSAAISDRDRFGILLQALAQSSRANLLSTPSITTLDNEPAEIVVGQNVPFRTGTFATDGDGVNPFTTIEREDVGITLRVLPRVSQGDVVQLEVSQEVSSLVGAVAGAADLVTNRRLIQTTVLADNGGTIVLGGLITDDRQSQEIQVPGLGDIPLLGRLFSSNTEGGTKRTLFVFLRPTILRTRSDIGQVSANRFQRLRSIEVQPQGLPAKLLREPKPVLRLPVEINGLY
jgi:general secretion pathway protein D